MKNKNLLTEVSNVFADLGLPNAEERLAKAQLAFQINLLIKKKKLNQQQAAELLQIDQPKISALHHGRLAGFSLERLFRFLNLLDHDITIKVVPKTRTKKQSAITVTVPKVKRSMGEIEDTTTVRCAMKARTKSNAKSRRAVAKKKRIR